MTRTARGVGPRASRFEQLAWIAALVAITTAANAREPSRPATQACIRASYDGQQLRDRGDYTRARAAFLECAAETCPDVIRNACAEWYDEMKVHESSLVFAARDGSGRDLANVRLMLDGKWVASSMDGRPVTVDPGSHAVRFEAEGHQAKEMQIVVRAGEKNRIVAVTLERMDGTARDAGPRAAPEPSARNWAVPIATGAMAAAFFATDVVLVASAVGDLHALEAAPCAATRTCDRGDVDSIETRLDVSKVFLVLGLVATGAFVGSLVWPRGRSGGTTLLRGTF